MLAEPHFVEAEFIGVQRLFLVLGERVGERARRRMHRHHENSKTHGFLRLLRGLGRRVMGTITVAALW